ncbi:MAG: hypothetical protein WD036_08475 [Bauldia sp.]
MNTRTKLISLGTAAALAVGIGTYAFSASSDESGFGFGPPFMRGMGPGMMKGMGPGMMGGGPGAMGMGPGMMGMAHDSATMAQLGVIHELFVNHDKITRTVTNLPDGIRTVTESNDPRITQILQEHVGDMLQRVDANDDPGLPIESPALRSIFENYDKIETKVESTENGIVVVQTSTDPETVAVLQQHASEVTDFVKEGMVALRTAMMKNMGGMMPGGMHGGMMGGGPNGPTAP